MTAYDLFMAALAAFGLCLAAYYIGYERGRAAGFTAGHRHGYRLSLREHWHGNQR